ncbi:adenosylhomocysteinase [Tindallia californiensis]|uniref:Adenosylhomocysteinase n=1 Tax=Tindallia californiensis TaxID=159292 RepID=A0A1H3PA39_9FIRM|nr:adenosylhomocysteinase [Tindallia californiensis]SDY97951.1 adenosylhomocysteinase [Tindallia californiensis]
MSTVQIMKDTKVASKIRNKDLAPQGKLKLDWVQAHMPLLNEVKQQFEKSQPFKGLKIAICLHLEAKTGYLAQVVQAGGADVVVCGSNPLSTQDDVVAALVDSGITAYAWHNTTDEEYHELINDTLDFEPDAIIDDGGDLVKILHSQRPEQAKTIIGGCEETTTGIHRLKALEKDGLLEFPMMAVNDAYCKYLFDNRYGTGQSVWDGINRTTNLVASGKTVVVIGYGWCGKGVAMRAKGLGAKVVVTEIDAIKALEAHMDGFDVMPMEKAASLGDVFITVTGNRDVISSRHFDKMKDGAVMCNGGHFDIEINKIELGEKAATQRTVRNNIEEYRMADGRNLFLIAGGRLVNLAAGDGHPVEVMDLTFALQALSLQHVVENKGSLPAKVLSVPEELDQYVANLRLKTLGITIDQLTSDQEAYLNSWA